MMLATLKDAIEALRAVADRAENACLSEEEAMNAAEEIQAAADGLDAMLADME